MGDIKEENDIINTIGLTTPATFSYNITQAFTKAHSATMLIKRDKKRSKTLDNTFVGSVNSEANDKGASEDNSKPKMHHLKENKEFVNKSFFNPAKAGIHNAYLNLKPNRVPSSRSHYSVNSLCSDISIDEEVHEDPTSEIKDRMGLWSKIHDEINKEE